MPGRRRYHRNSFIVQMFMSFCTMMLEFLEVLNLYNCNRWYCGGVPVGVLTASAINAAIYRKNTDINLPVLGAHTLGASGLMFWSIEYWNVSTRHRTEYYDTHAVYFSILFMANYLSMYRYFDRNTAPTNEEINNVIEIMRTRDREPAEYADPIGYARSLRAVSEVAEYEDSLITGFPGSSVAITPSFQQHREFNTSHVTIEVENEVSLENSRAIRRARSF